MEIKEKLPLNVTFSSDEMTLEDICINGEGSNVSFNLIHYVRFDDWWLIKILLKHKTQVFAAIILFRDALGNIKYSRDNIFTLEEKSFIRIKQDIIEYTDSINKKLIKIII